VPGPTFLQTGILVLLPAGQFGIHIRHRCKLHISYSIPPLRLPRQLSCFIPVFQFWPVLLPTSGQHWLFHHAIHSAGPFCAHFCKFLQKTY